MQSFQESYSHNANYILDQLKVFLELKSDKDLSELLSVNPSTISTWRSRDTVDFKMLIAKCNEKGIDLNSVFGSMENRKDHPDARILVISADKKGEENIIYVPEKAQAGYLNGFGDKKFILKLPSYRLPGFNNMTFRMFEVAGHSMMPTLHSGDLVIGEYLEDYGKIKNDRVYVVICHELGVVVKRILTIPDDTSHIISNSDNKSGDYPSVRLSTKDIKEMWYVKAYISRQLPSPELTHDKLARLEARIISLELDFKKKNEFE